MDRAMGLISRVIVITLGIILVIAASVLMTTWILLPLGIVTAAVGLMLIMGGVPEPLPERPAKAHAPDSTRVKVPHPVARVREREPEESYTI
jgi:hypothetical protein